MSLDAVITILSVVMAAFALIPGERRLDIQIRIHWFDYIPIALGIVAIHYILFFPVLWDIGIAPDLGPWRWGFTPELAIYLVIVLLAIYVLLRVRTSRLRRSGIYKFKELAERLLFARKFPELIYLVDRNFPQLVRISQNRYWQPSLRNILVSPLYLDIERAKRVSQWRDRIPKLIVEPLGKLLPTFESTALAAHETLHRVLLSDVMSHQIAAISPYFGIKALVHVFPQRFEFQDRWIWAMLDDKTSVLYYEIESNQNLSGAGRYDYHPENRILNFYFADATVAYELSVCAPFTEYAFNYFDRLHRDGASDRFNQQLDFYYEKDRWRCPVHACLRIFDFAVSEALFQDIPWHMGLWDLTRIASKITRNLNPDASIDMTAEWPTPYHYMLYMIVDMMTDWIGNVTDLKDDHRNSKLASDRFDHENNNIPKSSALALSYILPKIFSNKAVGIVFQTYILEIVLDQVDELQKYDAHRKYALLLLEAVARNGFAAPSEEYANAVRMLVERTDTRIRFGAGAMLKERISALRGIG